MISSTLRGTKVRSNPLFRAFRAISGKYSGPMPSSDSAAGRPREVKKSRVFWMAASASSRRGRAGSSPQTAVTYRAKRSSVFSLRTQRIQLGVRMARPTPWVTS